jgi:hypothetical protein
VPLKGTFHPENGLIGLNFNPQTQTSFTPPPFTSFTLLLSPFEGKTDKQEKHTHTQEHALGNHEFIY